VTGRPSLPGTPVPTLRVPLARGGPVAEVGLLLLLGKRAVRPFRSGLGGPEGNRTPDLFHAKEDGRGRPLSAFSAPDRPSPLPWNVSRVLQADPEILARFACQARLQLGLRDWWMAGASTAAGAPSSTMTSARPRGLVRCRNGNDPVPWSTMLLRTRALEESCRVDAQTIDRLFVSLLQGGPTCRPGGSPPGGAEPPLLALRKGGPPVPAPAPRRLGDRARHQ